MKDFIQNSNNLIIRKFSVDTVLHEDSSMIRINGVINTNMTIAEEVGDTADKLSGYLDEIKDVVDLIYSSIESKIEFMEKYCDSIVSNAKQIPTNTLGAIYTYFDDLELENMTYVKDVGYILGVD